MGLERIKAAAAQLDSVFEAAHNGIIVINTDEEIIYCNRAAARYIGLAADRIYGREITDVIPNSRLGQVLSEGKPHSDHLIIRDRMVITNRSPVFRDGVLVGAVAVFQDGSELQELLTKLQDAEGRLTSIDNIFEQAYDGVIFVDENGIVTRITNAYCRFLGVDPNDAVGRHCTEIIPNSRMHIVVKTGIAEIGEAMEVKGKQAVVMRIPLRENNRVVGAFGQVMFKDIQQVRTLAEKLHLLEHRLRFYEMELQHYQKHRYTFHDIIGQSASVQEAKALAEKASQSRSTVLLRGESGTGKEVFAHAIHAASVRSSKPFVRVNCGAIPAELLETELFGYEEGAFTGAKKGGKPGKFELANGGTIFLDEIGDLPLPMQAKVLRILQEREVERVGSTRLQALDIRVIAATNQHLEKMVANGEFRNDLYYRLNVFPILLPPLRERQGDVLMLSTHLLEKFNHELGFHVERLDEKVAQLFLHYPWPGNVRELQNALERAVNVAETDAVTFDDLPLYLRDSGGQGQNPGLQSLAAELAAAEKRAILNALKASKGNKAKAASILGIHRTNLYRKMAKYGMTPEEELLDSL